MDKHFNARGRLLPACLWLFVGCGPEANAPELGDAAAGGLDAAADTQLDASAEGDAGMQSNGEPSEAGLSDAAQLDAHVAPTRLGLVRHPLWARVAPAEDPFADGPPSIDCQETATAAEVLGDEPVFGVDTGFCNYVTVRQPALLSIAVGEVVKVRLWHFDLSAPQPADAHAALTVDGIPVLDELIGIPAQGGLLIREVRFTRAVAAGAPVLFHLHNHGANSWALVEVSKGPG